MINKRWEDLLIKINEKSKKQIVKNGETVEVNEDKKLFLMRYWFKLASENEEIVELETDETDETNEKIEDEKSDNTELETEWSDNTEINEYKIEETIEKIEDKIEEKEEDNDEVIVKKVMKRKR